MASLPSMFCYNSLLLSSSSCTSLYFYTHLPVFHFQWSQLCLYICTWILPHCMLMLSCFSHVWLFVTPWTIACQAPLSMRFSRQEYWTGLPCPPLGDLPDLGIKPCLLCLLHWQTGSSPLSQPGKPLQMNNSWTETTICLFQLLKTSSFQMTHPGLQWTSDNTFPHISSSYRQRISDKPPVLKESKESSLTPVPVWNIYQLNPHDIWSQIEMSSNAILQTLSQTVLFELGETQPCIKLCPVFLTLQSLKCIKSELHNSHRKHDGSSRKTNLVYIKL